MKGKNSSISFLQDLDVLGPLDTGLEAVSAGDHVGLGAGGQLAPQGPRLLKLEQLLPYVLTPGHQVTSIIIIVSSLP